MAFAAVGLLAGAVIMLAKRTGLFLSLAGSAFGVLGGVLYPIALSPRPFQLLAEALPTDLPTAMRFAAVALGSAAALLSLWGAYRAWLPNAHIRRALGAEAAGF